MLGKLLYGQFSLKESFWKFGVFGILFFATISKVCKAFIFQYLKGVSLFYYFTHYFSLLNINGSLLFFAALYTVSLAFLGVYSIIVFLGVWRSAAQYNKSALLANFAKIFIAAMIYFGFQLAL